jgi:hypothetical protein
MNGRRDLETPGANKQNSRMGAGLEAALISWISSVEEEAMEERSGVVFVAVTIFEG